MQAKSGHMSVSLSVAAGLVGGLAALLLAGCGGGGSATSVGPAGESSGAASVSPEPSAPEPSASASPAGDSRTAVEQAVRAYLDAANAAMATGDTAALRALSTPSAAACAWPSRSRSLHGSGDAPTATRWVFEDLTVVDVTGASRRSGVRCRFLAYTTTGDTSGEAVPATTMSGADLPDSRLWSTRVSSVTARTAWPGRRDGSSPQPCDVALALRSLSPSQPRLSVRPTSLHGATQRQQRLDRGRAVHPVDGVPRQPVAARQAAADCPDCLWRMAPDCGQTQADPLVLCENASRGCPLGEVRSASTAGGPATRASARWPGLRDPRTPLTTPAAAAPAVRDAFIELLPPPGPTSSRPPDWSRYPRCSPPASPARSARRRSTSARTRSSCESRGDLDVGLRRRRQSSGSRCLAGSGRTPR